MIRSIRKPITCLLAVFFTLNVIGQQVDYASLVNAQIGNKGKGARKEEAYLEAGYTFPGATYPFGMVQFTPTYFHPSKGFVVNQMSGAGCEHMGNFPTLPMTGRLQSSPGDMMGLNPGLSIEKAIAGYSRVNAAGIQCDLSVTPRTGMAVFEFPKDAKVGTVLVGSGINGTKINEASIKITGNTTCEGYADGGEFCGSPVKYKVYFVAAFDVPFKRRGTWKNDLIRNGSDTVTGPVSGAWFEFDTKKNKSIRYKFAISYVSIENARLNLQSENNGWNFEAIRTNAIAEWNKYLGRIAVAGSTPDHTTQFYTHLYHSFIHPNICNDVNGEYIGSDHKIHRTSKGDYYTGFSNWDTYRTQIQLLAMFAPEKTSDILNSIIEFAHHSGGGFPRWVLADTETGIMQGDPTSLLIANGYAFGAKQFNTALALEIMRRGAEIPGTKSQQTLTRPHLDQYLQKGYMNASMQLEYASADFAIGQFAKQAFNDENLYQQYLIRSQSWKNLYNPSTTWLQSRNEDGSWKKYNEDWREASYKNYFWMIPHNLGGLVKLMGGEAAAEKRLDSFFVKINASYDQEWFAAGNEPDFQVPWVYNWIGKPSKTQALVKRIIKEQYSNRPNGLPGNDDMGAMGAWYVFANIGLYPVVPATPGFSINSPSFPYIRLQLPKGEFVIKGGDPDKPYIHSLNLNGTSYNSTWLPLDKMAQGGTMNVELTAEPGSHWVAEELPPSFDTLPKTLNALAGRSFGPFRPTGKNTVLVPDSSDSLKNN